LCAYILRVNDTQVSGKSDFSSTAVIAWSWSKCFQSQSKCVKLYIWFFVYFKWYQIGRTITL